VTAAIGLEMSVDTELAAVVRAEPRPDRGEGHFHLAVVFYDAADYAVAGIAGEQVWCDPMPCAGLLPALRKAGCWPRFLEATDVAAASYEIKAAIRGRRVTAEPHEALKAAMMYAARRALATGFGFERRRVASDQSVLNAAAFAMWGAKVPPAEIF
jgi:hypothetical protein